MTPRAILLHDIERSGFRISEFDWEDLTPQLEPVSVKGGDLFLTPHATRTQWVFLAQGVAATEQARPDRTIFVTRFFQPGQLICLPPMKPAGRSGVAVCAITVIHGVVIPDRIFRLHYDHDTPMGFYLRQKVLETLSYDHDLMSMRAIGDPAHAKRFLESHHREILPRIPPAFLSRFLRPA